MEGATPWVRFPASSAPPRASELDHHCDLVEARSEVQITVYLRPEFATTSTHHFSTSLAEFGDRAGAGVWRIVRPAQPQLMPRVKPTQTTSIEGALPPRIAFDAAERARMVKRERRRLQKRRASSAREKFYLPQLPDPRARELRMALCYYRYAESELHPDLPHARGTGAGLAAPPGSRTSRRSTPPRSRKVPRSRPTMRYSRKPKARARHYT